MWSYTLVRSRGRSDSPTVLVPRVVYCIGWHKNGVVNLSKMGLTVYPNKLFKDTSRGKEDLCSIQKVLEVQGIPGDVVQVGNGVIHTDSYSCALEVLLLAVVLECSKRLGVSCRDTVSYINELGEKRATCSMSGQGVYSSFFATWAGTIVKRRNIRGGHVQHRLGNGREG